MPNSSTCEVHSQTKCRKICFSLSFLKCASWNVLFYIIVQFLWILSDVMSHTGLNDLITLMAPPSHLLCGLFDTASFQDSLSGLWKWIGWKPFGHTNFPCFTAAALFSKQTCLSWIGNTRTQYTSGHVGPSPFWSRSWLCVHIGCERGERRP